jgi:hypothetical protein
MKIKELIEQLQTLYEKELEYVDVMGEPEIMVDCFKRVEQGVFHYAGFTDKVEIQRSEDGVYLIINGFAND